MTFLSGVFFIFLLLTIIFYFFFPRQMRWFVLLVSSVIFYLSWSWEALLIILASTFLVYLAGRKMDSIYRRQDEYLQRAELRAEDKKIRKVRARERCRTVLLTTATILVIVLVYCKVGERLIDGIRTMLGANIITDEQGVVITDPLPWLKVIVPLGVSYYTFSMISYLADIYWRKDRAEYNFLKLLLWVLFFPKIIQGPIARHKKMAKQLNEGSVFDYQRVCYGMQLALWGYFKKMVIADRLAIFVNTVFSNCYEEKGSLVFIVAAMFGSIQLYCDFSGCMDMAGGFCQILGIDLEKNFDHPFFSKTAAEFWRRWHITLGTWFKDYIYMPLVISPRLMKAARFIKKRIGAKASKDFMLIVPTAVVWFLTGLWHGTGYNYIAWGIYWGILIIASSIFSQSIKKVTKFLKINTEAGSWKVLQMIRTFLLFSFARLITLPGHLRTTWDILKQIGKQFDVWIFFDGTLYNYGLDALNFWLAILGIVVLWCVSMLQEKGSVRAMIANNNIVIRWLIYYAAIFSVLILGIYGPGYSASAFIYAGF